MVKASAADTLVESKTLAKDGVLEEQVLKNVGKADRTIKPYYRICTLKETTNVTAFNKENNNVSISIGIAGKEMNTVNFVSDTGAGPTLIRENFLRQERQKLMKPDQPPDLKSATSNSFCIPGVITLHVMMGD